MTDMRFPDALANTGGGTTVAQVLQAIGALMKECHAESLSLQDAVSVSMPIDDISLARLETYQHLDHMTQVNEDLSRLLPAMAAAVNDGITEIDHLAGTLRLVSLRDRLFRQPGPGKANTAVSGDVSFF